MNNRRFNFATSRHAASSGLNLQPIEAEDGKSVMRGKKIDLGEANCGIARSLQIIGDRWTLLIVREAFHGRQRFGEFQKSLGLAKNILSVRLKKLIDDGIFEIESVDDSPLSRRYCLTPKGEQLCVVLVALWQWGGENCFEGDALNSSMVDKFTGATLPKLQLTAQDGRILGPRDFHLKSSFG
jgi:DNA-binding HxlR family transcriptional regulator